MKRPVLFVRCTVFAGLLLVGLTLGCLRELYPPFLVSGYKSSSSASGTLFAGLTFTENLIQERTFTDGTSVTTVTYLRGDSARVPQRVDFNNDGKLDPVVGYGEDQAVIQILLSTGAPGVVEFVSLTLDSKRDMENLSDVAVADIDNDGALDIVAAASAAVWYFHHPSNAPTTELRLWGNTEPTDELRERVDASFAQLTDAELQAIITQALGPGVNLDDYIVTIDQRYTNVEVADFDNDGDNDIASSRSFIINLEPRPDSPVEPLQIVDGDVFIFLNPGRATNGVGWAALSIGGHERQTRLDRDGAAGLLAVDVDRDGDLDVVSAASRDNNVQIAWFENPGGALDADDVWQQWRIGSIRDARAVDVADLTGDGRVDVVGIGGEQMQMLLFEQPADDPRRPYDWDSHVIVTFETYEPSDLKMLDMDNDGQLELVVGGSEGAVRFFESPSDPTQAWDGAVVVTYDPPGNVGLLGYGDLDGDGDLDLVAVVNSDADNEERITWIRNDFTVLNAALP